MTALSEFELIARYFATDAFELGLRDDILVGIGDDAAVLRPAVANELVLAVDSLVAGVHFPEGVAPRHIGYRALAVNLSDLAAMGAMPRWFTLALTIPELSEQWLREFSDGLAQAARDSGCALVGGDTTRGPLTITVQIGGEVPSGQALLRNGASLGDLIFVTGYPGLAALGLRDVESGRLDSVSAHTFLRPTPRVQFGTGLLGIASAAIDVSDGLLPDLGHILDASGVAAELDCELLPLAKQLKRLPLAEAQCLALTGGDDYELCFTVPPSKRDKVIALAKTLQTPCCQIGQICFGEGISLLGSLQEPAELARGGFRHF